MLPAYLNFLAMYVITGLFLRYLEATFPDKPWAKALMVIH